MRLMASAILIPLSSTIHCASHPILHGSNRYRLSCVIASLIFLLLLIRWTLWRSKTSLCGRDIDPLTCMFSAPGWGSAYWWCLLHRAWTEYIRCHQPQDHTQCHNHGWSHVLFDSSWQRSPSPLWFTWTWALSCSPRLVFFYFKMFSESFRRSLISTLRSLATSCNVLRFGWAALLHQRYTVDSLTCICSASHFPVLFFSTKTNFIRFSSFSILN